MRYLLRSFSLLLVAVFSLSSAVVVGAPAVTNSTAAAASAKKPVPGPFHGKVAAVDKTARTIQVGKRVFHVSPDCKLTKGGKAARLEDAVIGEECGGYMRPSEDGRLVATTLRLGPKVATATAVPAPAAPRK
jgi:hypothetical protein